MVVSSSRRAGRVTNKTRLLVYRGSDKVDLGAAETIVWDEAGGADAAKNQHVGAKGVDTGEFLEHHLQAALSSASLLHSRPATKPPSPSPAASRAASAKPEQQPKEAAARETKAAGAAAAVSALNYHIPTPDATGLADTTDYAQLYQVARYAEPVNYVRFSDTVEESSAGPGGLGYCMDDDDLAWLAAFNAKHEGASGEVGSGGSAGGAGGTGASPAQARERRKGKDKEKPETPAPLVITEDTFEYIMGVLERHAEVSVPMLHTDLALMPAFPQVEPLFSSPLAASFYPSNETPRGLPECRALARMARNVFPHWRGRRERRQGKPIFPSLNYDETNDNDPYVCFRRRDVRLTRKTRRTDNFSVERMQKLQYELRKAHEISQMVFSRETQKRDLFKADRAVWEAKWKLFETKRRWPSLGMTREEEEIITGRQTGAAAAAAAAAQISGGAAAQAGIAQAKKKAADKDKEERERRERAADAARQADHRAAPAGRSMAPEVLKERMQALQLRLEHELARRKQVDATWDDCTDNSYQALPTSSAEHAFRPITALDPSFALDDEDDEDDEDDPAREAKAAARRPLMVHPHAFRLRRGRGGAIRLDRRSPTLAFRRGALPSSPTQARDWLFPDMVDSRASRRRPRSIDDADDDPVSDDAEAPARKRRLNEFVRYDAKRGGALGVGMGLARDDDRVVLDDYDAKYIRHRITLLSDDDVAALQPDVALLADAAAEHDVPVELPQPPVFVKPPPQVVHLQQQQMQQQMMQQQQLEQYQQIQMMAQQRAIEHARLAQQQQQQQAAFVVAQAQAQAQADAQARGAAAGAQPGQPPNQLQQPNGAGTPNANGHQQMPPPAGTGRPQPVKRASSVASGAGAGAGPRPSLSPTAAIHANQQQQQLAQAQAQQQQQLLNGQSPQLLNAVLANGAKFPQPAPGQAAVDARVRAQLLAANNGQLAPGLDAAAANVPLPQQPQPVAVPANALDALSPEQRAELSRIATAKGFASVQAFLAASTVANANSQKQRMLLAAAKAQQLQQQQQAAAAAAAAGKGVPRPNGAPAPALPQTPGTTNGHGNGAGNGHAAPGTPQQNFGSPAVGANGGMQLKLPPHAAARLATQQAAQAQRT